LLIGLPSGDNGKTFGGGYVYNKNGESHAGAGGVVSYSDAFGNTVELGTFTAFGGEATNEEKYGYFANLTGLYLASNGCNLKAGVGAGRWIL
jgi:hypothetical protein